jgi:hypothetical protein
MDLYLVDINWLSEALRGARMTLKQQMVPQDLTIWGKVENFK